MDLISHLITNFRHDSLGNCTTLLFNEVGSGFRGKAAGGGAGFVNVFVAPGDDAWRELDEDSGCIGP